MLEKKRKIRQIISRKFLFLSLGSLRDAADFEFDRFNVCLNPRFFLFQDSIICGVANGWFLSCNLGGRGSNSFFLYFLLFPCLMASFMDGIIEIPEAAGAAHPSEP